MPTVPLFLIRKHFVFPTKSWSPLNKILTFHSGVPVGCCNEMHVAVNPHYIKMPFVCHVTDVDGYTLPTVLDTHFWKVFTPNSFYFIVGCKTKSQCEDNSY